MNVLPTRARSFIRDLPWADAGHAALISAAPAILAVLSGEPRFGWSAIAAFWACFADPGGPLSQRLHAMCWVAAVGALFCFLGSAAQHVLWVLLPLTFLCCTLASFAQVWGPAAAIIGTLVSAGFVVSTELPAHGIWGSAAYAAFFIGGGAWSIVMTALVWRRRPWRHATAAVAQCYVEIAGYAGELCLLYLPTRKLATHGVSAANGLSAGASSEDYAAVSAAHRKTLRAQIESARKRVGEVMSSRPSRMQRAQQLLNLLDSAEHAFVTLVALADTMAALSSQHRAKALPQHNTPSYQSEMRLRDASILRVLHRFAQACNVIARTSDINETAQRQHLQDALSRTEQAVRQAHQVLEPDTTVDAKPNGNANASVDADPALPTLLPLLERLLRSGGDAVAALIERAPSADSLAKRDRAPTERASLPAWRMGFRQLRENLHGRSSIMRHALRVGVAATVSVAMCKILDINHGYWMSLTVVFILQPYLASTWQRTTHRIVGSVAGAVGASLVGVLLPSPLAVAIAVLPIALGTFVGRTIHYAVFTFFLTLQFVLVAEIQQPEAHEFTLALLRAMNSVYGGLLALVIGMVLWPERAQDRLASVLSEAVDRHARYIKAVLEFGQPTDSSVATAPLMTLRRDACLSADNAQIVLQGLLGSPLHRRGRAPAVANLIAALRSMTGAATVLELQPFTNVAGEHPDLQPSLAQFTSRLNAALQALAARIRTGAYMQAPRPAKFVEIEGTEGIESANTADATKEESLASEVPEPPEAPSAAGLKQTDSRSLALSRIAALAQEICRPIKTR